MPLSTAISINNIESEECAVIVYQITNDKTNFIFKKINKTSEKMEHIKAADVIGKRITDVFPKIKEFGLFDVLMKVHETGVTRIHPLTLYQDENRHAWRRTFVAKTSPTQLTVSYQDAIVDYNNHHSVEVFKTILQFSSDSVAITDVNANIQYVNDTFVHNTGYSKEVLLSNKMNILRSGEHDDIFYQDMWLSLNNYQIWEGEIINRHSDGHFFLDKTTIIPIYTDNKVITDFVTIKKDITDIKEKEMLFRKHIREAQMGEMVSIIAHQWKQPLSSLSATISSMYLENELKKPIDASKMLSRYTSMLSTIQFLSLTLDEFRTFFSPKETSSQENLSKIISETSMMMQSSLHGFNIEVINDVPAYLTINTYKNEIKHVFLNLLKNFIDIVEEKKIENPKIIFNATEGENHIYLTIEDNGGGIAEDHIDKIFLAHFTTKGERQGTGLGLYMSKLVLEEHCNGTISVENSVEGALFKITIKKI